MKNGTRNTEHGTQDRRRRTRLAFLAVVAVCLLLVLLLDAADEEKVELRVGLNELKYEDGQLYFLYVSEKALADPAKASILAQVHGYSTDYDEHEQIAAARSGCLRWQALAEQEGWLVLAPYFYDRSFHHYQSLNVNAVAKGKRADLRLNELVKEVGEMLPGIRTDKIYLVGFSAGGQFALRYAAYHPAKIIRVAAGGAGFYTWPDERFSYPVGLKVTAHYKSYVPDFRKLAKTDLLVFIGDNDINQLPPRKSWGKYNVVAIQGDGRCERAKNWVKAMREYAETNYVNCRIKLWVVPGVGHTITYGMIDIISGFLSGRSDFGREQETEAVPLHLQ